MATAPFPVTPELAAVAIRYSNADLIADQVLPRVPVGRQEFKHMAFPAGEEITIPDTKVGRRSDVAEIEFTGQEVASRADAFGLQAPIPQEDIENAIEGYDPLGRATQALANLILLDREVRTAALVFALGTYPAAQRTTLAGSSQWSDITSLPIAAITDAMDTMQMRPNTMVLGQTTWTKLRRHPQIVKAVYGYANDSGMATRKQVADLFELRDILVGQAWVNTAKRGQTVTRVRTWGAHCALLHINGQGDANGMIPTFGYTAQFRNRVAGSMADSKMGLMGGQRVKVGEYVKEVIAAPDFGYFFQNAVA